MTLTKASIAFIGLATASLLAAFGFLGQERISTTTEPFNRLTGTCGTYRFEGRSNATDAENGIRAMREWPSVSYQERQYLAMRMMIGRSLQGLTRQEIISKLGDSTKLERCNPTTREGWPAQCLVYDLTLSNQDWFYFCIELRNERASNVWVQVNN
jgi:hypothetical protein